MRPPRALIALAFGCALAPSAASAEPKECVSSYESAQELRLASKLRDSREQLRRCQKSDCSRAIRKDCVAWLAEVEKGVPSLLVTVVEPSGREARGAQVSLDGAPLPSLDGAIELDPGPHALRAQGPGFSPVEERLTVAEGEQRRKVKLTLAPAAVSAPAPTPTPTPTPAPAPRVPLATWVAAGAAGVGFAVGAYFYVSARGGERELVGRGCAPNCPGSEVDVVRRDRTLTYVGLGAGLLGLGAAAFFYLTRPTVEASAGSPRFDVAALPGGALGVASWGLR